MTHATPTADSRHDTLTRVTGKSGRGTARQTIRVDESLWERFAEATALVGLDRSSALREFVRWYVGDADAKMPRRPKIDGNTRGTKQSDR